MEENAAASRRESQQKRRKRRIEWDWEPSGDTGEHWGLAGASGLVLVWRWYFIQSCSAHAVVVLCIPSGMVW